MSGVNGLYVASNPTALSAQFNLVRNMGDLANTLTRLSTGLRINSAKDDPAGLIASELLKSDIAGTSQAITNIQRGNSMLSSADSAMGNIGSLLTDIKSLVVGAANTGAMNADQISANQLQVNATLEAIDQIAMSTTYGGQKILDGSMDFTTNSNLSSGISDVTVSSANFGTGNSIAVNVNVLEAAKSGTLIYNGTGVNQRTTLDITGSVGTKTITVGTAGQFTSNQKIADAINTVSDSTGVAAYVEGQAARGSVTLSSTGGNNDIVITANQEGLNAGNYSFRITQGTGDNSARIVKDAANGQQGVVEISLKGSYEQNFNNFAGLFDINVNTGEASGARSVSITRGTANSAVYYDSDRNATGTSNGKTITASIASSDTAHTSNLNGWTIKVDSTKADATAKSVADLDTKTLYVHSTAATDTDIAAALGIALGNTVNSVTAAAPTVTVGLTGTLAEGDTIKLGGGADAGEIAITYKEGATAGDIQKMLNSIEGVTASLKSGVSSNQLIPALPTNSSYVAKADTDAQLSKFASSVNAADVVALINSQLGGKFNAQMLSGDTGSGKVNFMDASALYGDINSDNMLRFSGMDNGPVVRMTNLDSNGTKVANQALSVEIKHPSDEDIKAGIHTPVLEIHLATDAAGNSITTAQDIAKLFDSLSAAQTLGVSAEVVAPPGVDINGRIWTTDSCGNAIEIENCGSTWGLGIVQPTSAKGSCGAVESDLALLGSNQNIVADYAVARVASGNAVAAADAVGVSSSGGAAAITIKGSSALNGVTFNFTTDETKEGFVVNGSGKDATGTLTIYLDPSLQGGTFDTADSMQSIIAGAVAANWEAIREYTGATGEPVAAAGIEVTAGGEIEDITTAISNIGNSYTIGKTTSGDLETNQTAGVGVDDPALLIKAKTAGTDMAGISIHFVNDPTKGLAAVSGASGAAAAGTAPDISVEFQTKSDGSRELIVYANIDTAAGGGINAADLAAALNNNDVFKANFTAEATLAGSAGDAEAVRTANTVTFNSANAIEQSTYKTVGGYKVASSNEAGTTSSGLNMIGQSDSNERLVLVATDVGSENFVKVAVREGSFDTYCPKGTRLNELHGTDAVATVNGLSASARGNTISLQTSDLALSVKTDGTVGTKSFDITGGGALFQIGPDVISSQQKRLGIASMMTTAIGGESGKLFQLKSGGAADLTTSDLSRKLADKIVNESISYVASARGRIGAVQSSLFDPMINVLQDQLVSLTDAQGSIANADFAEESSRLTSLQLLLQSGMSTLGIAGQLPQYAASLVR